MFYAKYMCVQLASMRDTSTDSRVTSTYSLLLLAAAKPMCIRKACLNALPTITLHNVIKTYLRDSQLMPPPLR